MANCVLTNGIPIECMDNTGGIKNVYIGAFSDATTFTYDADEIIDTVTSAETYYTFKFRPQTSSLTEEGTASVENGTNFFTQNISMSFHKMSATNRNTMLLLIQASTHVIVEDQNGLHWWCDFENGANVTAQTNAAGQAYGDLNGNTVTLTGLEPLPMHQLSAVAFGTLTTAA